MYGLLTRVRLRTNRNLEGHDVTTDEVGTIESIFEMYGSRSGSVGPKYYLIRFDNFMVNRDFIAHVDWLEPEEARAQREAESVAYWGDEVAQPSPAVPPAPVVSVNPATAVLDSYFAQLQDVPPPPPVTRPWPENVTQAGFIHPVRPQPVQYRPPQEIPSDWRGHRANTGTARGQLQVNPNVVPYGVNPADVVQYLLTETPLGELLARTRASRVSQDSG